MKLVRERAVLGQKDLMSQREIRRLRRKHKRTRRKEGTMEER